MSEYFKDLGSLLGDLVIYSYIYLAVVCFVAGITVILVIAYVKRSKQKKEDDNKKYILWRIGIIVLIAALILILSPVIMGLLLQ